MSKTVLAVLVILALLGGAVVAWVLEINNERMRATHHALDALARDRRGD